MSPEELVKTLTETQENAILTIDRTGELIWRGPGMQEIMDTVTELKRLGVATEGWLAKRPEGPRQYILTDFGHAVAEILRARQRD